MSPRLGTAAASRNGRDAGRRQSRPQSPRSKRREAGGVPFSAAQLQGMTFPPVKFAVPRYIVEGLTLLAGSPRSERAG